MTIGRPHPEEQLSAVFDGESTDPVSLPEERRQELENGWFRLRAELQALPVESCDLVSAVREELSEPTRRGSDEERARRTSWVPTLTVLASVAAAIVLLVLPSPDDVDPIEAHRQHVAVLRKHVDRLVPDPARCNVVVINVAAETSVEESVREMLGAAEAQGAAVTALHSQVDEGAEYSAGFLLTSGSEPQAILESMSGDSEQILWNPVNVGGRSHEEIKEMFLASMKVPTESDKVFGAMYVVNEDSLVVSLEQLPADATGESAAAGSVAVAARADDQETNAETTSAAVELPAAAPAADVVSRGEAAGALPLIVIFRKQGPAGTEESLPGQGELQNGVLSPPSV